MESGVATLQRNCRNQLLTINRVSRSPEYASERLSKPVAPCRREAIRWNAILTGLLP